MEEMIKIAKYTNSGSLYGSFALKRMTFRINIYLYIIYICRYVRQKYIEEKYKSKSFQMTGTV